MISSYVCSLNSALFLHTDKKHRFLLLETNKCKNAFAFDFYLFMFALNLYLHRFRNEPTRSLTNGNHFSSIVIVTVWHSSSSMLDQLKRMILNNEIC